MYSVIRNLAIFFCGIFLLSPILSSCRKIEGEDVDSVSTVYKPRYATGFRIDSLEDGRKRLVVTRPWQGAEETQLTFDLDSSYSRLASMSATYLAMLDQVDEASRVVAQSSIKYVYNDSIRNRLSEDADFGYEGNIDFEKLIKADPDLTLIYSSGGRSSMEGKLMELGIPYIYMGDYAEENPLGKAEWMVVIGELTGNRLKAISKFSEIESGYLREKKLARQNPKTELETDKPKVMINAPYGDSWFCPPSKSYAVTLIEDAGGSYLLSDIKGSASKPIDMEKGVILGEEADIWLHPGNVSSLAELNSNVPQLASSKVVKKGRVYVNTLRSNPEGGNDYFETGTVRPDLILKDLRKIMEGDSASKELYFYKRLM